jgi:hypothetical protein
MEEITTSHGWKPANNGIDQLVQDFATIHCEEQIWKLLFLYMGVPHWSSILIGLCIINHPFFGRFPILGNPHFSDPIQSKSSGSARDGTKLHAWLLSSRPLGASTMFWCAKKGWRKVEYAGRIIYILYTYPVLKFWFKWLVYLLGGYYVWGNLEITEYDADKMCWCILAICNTCDLFGNTSVLCWFLRCNEHTHENKRIHYSFHCFQSRAMRTVRSNEPVWTRNPVEGK